MPCFFFFGGFFLKGPFNDRYVNCLCGYTYIKHESRQNRLKLLDANVFLHLLVPLRGTKYASMRNFTYFPLLLPHFPHHCSDVFFSLLPSNIFFITALRRFISSKMAVTLETLPVEVQHKIVGIVNSTTDLHSLCLVSKQISAVSATYLYRDFNFPFMTPDAAERLCITLANSNGLLPWRQGYLRCSLYRVGNQARNF